MPINSRVQTLRSSTALQRPPSATRSPGELYVNFADLQLGVIDAAQAPQDLLAIRRFSTLTSYSIGDFVVQSGQLYRASAPSPAGAFTPANWSVVFNAGNDGAGSTADADLLDGQQGSWYQDRANHTGSQAQSTVTNLTADLAARVLKVGDTMTGQLTIAPVAGTHPTLQLTKAQTGDHNVIRGYLGTNQRWSMALGSGLGNDRFDLARYNDAGTFLDYVLIGDRTTGLFTVKGDPTTGLGIATKQYVDAVAASISGYNMVVNPTFVISQEYPSGTLTGGQYFADQWYLYSANGGLQGTPGLATAPAPSNGRFAGRLYCSTADTSIVAADIYGTIQKLEGINIAALLWGAPQARSAILRFEVLCGSAGSAGTYYASLRDSTAAKSIVFPFTVANTGNWQTFEFLVPPCTDGTWPTDNSLGGFLGIMVSVGTTYHAPASGSWQNGNYIAVAGGTNMMSAVGNNLYIGNVGLYVDPGNGEAPPFVQPDYEMELIRCNRYYQGNLLTMWSGYSSGVGTMYALTTLRAPMRAAPTLSGASTAAVGFPASIGTLLYTAGRVREARVSNAANSGAYFSSSVDASARM